MKLGNVINIFIAIVFLGYMYTGFAGNEKSSLMRAKEYIIQGECSSAIDLLKKEVEQESSPEIYYNLAFCYQQTENFIAAKTAIEKAHDALSNEPSVLLLGAEIFMALDLTEQAISYYSKYINANPSDSSVRVDRAHAYLSIGHDEKAIQDFLKAIELKENSKAHESIIDPELHEFYFGLAGVYVEKMNYPEAEKYLKMAIKSDPSVFLGYIGLANIYSDSSSDKRYDIDKAIENADMAVKLTSELDASVLQTLAELLLVKGEYKRARAVINQVHVIQPQDPYILNTFKKMPHLKNEWVAVRILHQF